MEILIPLLISSMAGLSTVLGALIIFLNIKNENINKFITFCLSFSIAIMIAISITDLIPASLFDLLKQNSFIGLILSLIAFFLGIFNIKILTNKINKIKNNTNNLYKLGILNMIALMLHNFPEGIVTFLSSVQDINLGIKLSIAIMLHNIPEGISIAVPIYFATKDKKTAIKKTLISGLAEPLGALLAYIFLKNFITNTMINLIMLLVAGIMITISIEEMFPETLKYKENKWIIFGFIVGILLIIISHIFL